jgi:hypothetical protein
MMTPIEAAMIEATAYRMIRDVVRSDPNIGPDAAELIRDVLRMNGERVKPRAMQKNHADY